MTPTSSSATIPIAELQKEPTSVETQQIQNFSIKVIRSSIPPRNTIYEAKIDGETYVIGKTPNGAVFQKLDDFIQNRNTGLHVDSNGLITCKENMNSELTKAYTLFQHCKQTAAITLLTMGSKSSHGTPFFRTSILGEQFVAFNGDNGIYLQRENNENHDIGFFAGTNDSIEYDDDPIVLIAADRLRLARDIKNLAMPIIQNGNMTFNVLDKSYSIGEKYTGVIYLQNFNDWKDPMSKNGLCMPISESDTITADSSISRHTMKKVKEALLKNVFKTEQLPSDPSRKISSALPIIEELPPTLNQPSNEHRTDKEIFNPSLNNSNTDSVEKKFTKEKVIEILGKVSKTAEAQYRFNGFSIHGGRDKTKAASYNAAPAIRDGKMHKDIQIMKKRIGFINTRYTWKKQPTLANNTTMPKGIKNAGVLLPKGLTMEQYTEMRKIAQQNAASNTDITSEQVPKLAIPLGGVVIEATLREHANALLNDNGKDVDIHCIFQTGLNFAMDVGGGIPLINHKEAKNKIPDFTKKNAITAVNAAIRNGSDLLVFNLGIGTGFFGGAYADEVKQCNVNGICKAVIDAKKSRRTLEIVVPNVGLSTNQKTQLGKAGIRIIDADKDAVAMLCAREGLKVSKTIAGDPMSMLGIHGPGFWWETAGSASDEERAAYLSPCYALGYMPIEVFEHGAKPPVKIAAISEFMVKA